MSKRSLLTMLHCSVLGLAACGGSAARVDEVGRIQTDQAGLGGRLYNDVEPGKVEGLEAATHAFYVVGGDNDTIFGVIFSSAHDYCTRDRGQNHEPPDSTNVLATLHNFTAGQTDFPVQSISAPKTHPTYANVKVETWDNKGVYAGGQEAKSGNFYILPRNLHDDVVGGHFTFKLESGEELEGRFKARACTSLR